MACTSVPRQARAIKSQVPRGYARVIPWTGNVRLSNSLNNSLVLDTSFLTPLPPCIVFTAWKARGSNNIAFDIHRQWRLNPQRPHVHVNPLSGGYAQWPFGSNTSGSGGFGAVADGKRTSPRAGHLTFLASSHETHKDFMSAS